jgi:outer membrane protein assembly factor BamB
MNRKPPLRLWPGVIAVVLLVLTKYGWKAAVPGFKGFAQGMQASFICAVLVILWWLFFSRAPWSERLGGFGLMIAALGAAWGLKHESMGPFFLFVYAVPLLCVALVAWAVATRGLADGPRRATMVATVVAVCGVWTLLRTEGISGDHVAKFAWRWSLTGEEKLQALGVEAPVGPRPVVPSPAAPSGAPMAAPSARPSAGASEPPAAPAPVVEAGTEWPGFRGPHRDGVVRGVRIATDWSASPPVLMWRRPVGPGWSSFAVRGNVFYTQEQRGEEELVAAYEVATGNPVWTHRDRARFFESNAGAGPRATPTLSGDHVYAFGATGILNALRAQDGSLAWSRNVASDTGANVPTWGFSSSPVVAGDVVIVAAAGQLAAYDRATGAPRWRGSALRGGYSSPHLVTIGGVAQVVLMSNNGTTSVAPADGALLWEHRWGGMPMVQPALVSEGDVLVSASAESGMRRLSLARTPGGWAVEERWTSPGMKPYFNDYVVHRGHAFGFDARILASIDLQDGTRKWKGGRYGNGQLVLLADQDILLVLSEEGELALVGATADRFTELARFPAIQGKTWNHPVLIGDTLLVRNAEEMAAFRLALAR